MYPSGARQSKHKQERLCSCPEKEEMANSMKGQRFRDTLSNQLEAKRGDHDNSSGDTYRSIGQLHRPDHLEPSTRILLVRRFNQKAA